MNLAGKKIPLPGVGQLSFSPLLDRMKARLDEFGGAEAVYMNDLIQRSEVLDMDGGLGDKDLKKHRPLVEELLRVLFPPSLTDNEIKAVSSPWDFKTVYTTQRMKKILDNAGDDYSLDYTNVNEDELYIASCAFILALYYGYEVPSFKSFYFEIPNIEKGQRHFYRLANNADFIRVQPGEKSLDITQDDYHQLMDNYRDIKLWKKKFPKGSWVFSGFMILNLMDLTTDQVITNLTSNLLDGQNKGISTLQNDISELLKKPVTVSFISMKGRKLIQGEVKVISSMMMGVASTLAFEDVLCEWSYQELIENENDLAIPDVKAFAARSDSLFAQNLLKAGLKSYYIAQIFYGGKRFGFIELGSTSKGTLTSATGLQIDEILPILSVAGNRLSMEHENRVEAIIQAECTTIHPSVKWRFVEEANKHIVAEKNGEEHNFSNLVFKDVFPLYGQLDIRNSSVRRNEGIKHDLQSQLAGAKAVLVSALKHEKLPLYEEIIYTLDSHHALLETDMISASEQDILQFLSNEVEPILEHLSSRGNEVKKAYDAYLSTLHPELGFMYRERQAFDDAVNTVNKVLSRYIDKMQANAQGMFPHHFERYATDGLEFNMYIGESISPNQGFHPLLIKNLRLWQLMVMVEMEREYAHVKKDLKQSLAVAALVLAHSQPLSIQYRLDEKQFDVEGAYNARYEIIKKRIDKANIKGTTERITEPGKMVVVYSTEEDEREYLRYFKFLQSKGYLEDKKPEILVLEDLQGVSGLKALRLGIDYGKAKEVSTVSMEEIMQEIEGKGTKEKA